MPVHERSVKSYFARLLEFFIPNHFLESDEAFQAKVILIYSAIIGLVAFSVVVMIGFAENTLSWRRLLTLLLCASLLLAFPILRYSKNIRACAWYVLFISMALTFHLDFNNRSLDGPDSVVWTVPLVLAALLLKGKTLWIYSFTCIGLFTLNAYLLNTDKLPPSITNPDSWFGIKYITVLATCMVVVLITQATNRQVRKHMAELKNRVHEINKLKIKADASNRSKSTFLATMSHELRTPLNSVIGNAQLLANADLTGKSQKQAQDISEAGQLLLSIINDILDLSKLEANQLELVNKPYNLTEQMHTMKRLTTPRLQNNVQLLLELPSDHVYINSDQNRMAQVLINLLSNAAKFTDFGIITLGLDSTEHGIVISVADTGIGIKEKDMAKLFNRFSQVSHDSDRNMGGSGLGLAISLGIVKQMGGDIDVSSTPGEGSCFKVILPNIQPASDMGQVPKANPYRQRPSFHYTGLIVDDIVMNQVVLQDMVAEMGMHQVATANSGQQALDFIAENMSTQVVFMDMRMPKMDGLEATRELRKMGYKGQIIAVTANATEEDKEACLSSGMNDFISKPITLEQLSESLSKVS